MRCLPHVLCVAVAASASLRPLGRPRPVNLEVPDGLSPPVSLSTVAPQDVRNLSKVDGVLGEVHESYSGFFDTDNRTKHMFWWYFPAPTDDAPLLIWLQGGPGGSSLFGLFTEMGPYVIGEDLTVSRRPVAWTDRYAMLFIDNPVGAGFSYTTGTYCEDTRECVARNLFELLQQFYAAFPETLKQDLYVTGESYAGHYVPAIAAYMAERSTESPMPLKGVAIGDGWVDPVNMIGAYPEMMFGQGLISTQEKKVIQEYCDQTLAHIKSGNMYEAFNVWDQMLNGDVFPYANYFHNITGSNDYDNLMNTNADPVYFLTYLNQGDVRKSIHIGDAQFQSGAACEHNLLRDFMVSFKPEVELLLQREYKVLVYSGQLDIIIGAALTESFLPGVQWAGSGAFAAAPKAVWRMDPTDSEVAGFVNSGGGLIYAVVRGAGHMVPADQPERAFNMIQRFVDGESFPSFPDPLPSAKVEMV